jgi:hypothetical protein
MEVFPDKNRLKKDIFFEGFFIATSNLCGISFLMSILFLFNLSSNIIGSGISQEHEEVIT